MKRIKERGRFQEENVPVLFLLHKAYVPAIIMYHDRAEGICVRAVRAAYTAGHVSQDKSIMQASSDYPGKGGCVTMKKLEIIIKPEKLEDLKGILEDCKANGIMISNIMGYGNQKGYKQMYRGTEYTVNLLPKVKVETVVCEEICEKIVERVIEEINTGNYGDGKIFIYDVQDAVRIRTGERGEGAL